MQPYSGYLKLIFILLFLSAGVLPAQPPKKSLQPLNGSTAFQQLMAGNNRYVNMHPLHPDQNRHRFEETAVNQHPIAVVVCCSDSRVAPELFFDQGIGDLFVIRTAGNVLGNFEIGSIEYAVEHLNVHLIMIVGHEHCGAIQAMADHSKNEGFLQVIIDSLAKEPEIAKVGEMDQLHTLPLIKANVLHGIHQLLTQSTYIQQAVKDKGVQVIGGIYQLNNGKVIPLDSSY
ncbi:MAG: carbonic anhydrase [Sphingobacteriales bacterium]|uniref:carbonic anhydrase n=1 Tax=Hydrotalea flava TaxID=714549 RepID=UPI00082BD032|nr:carbonic anhydrase [Hydrotalea flava]RTL52042.1 MAG: carbonic anhydrase [Sphingobacteriales bacterium]